MYISHLSLSEMNYIPLCMLCITMYITPMVSNSLSEDNACICCMKVFGKLIAKSCFNFPGEYNYFQCVSFLMDSHTQSGKYPNHCETH